MAKKSLNSTNTLNITRVTRTIYFFVAVIALSIVLFDSGNLITKEAIVDRWILLSVVFAINTATWFICSQAGSRKVQKTMLVLLTLSLLVFAGYMTYWERGMASTSTILYVLPLLTIASLKNRHALLAVAALASGTYALATVKYFNDFFNEGYRIQLWASIVQYVGVIFVATWLIMIVAELRHDSK